MGLTTGDLTEPLSSGDFGLTDGLIPPGTVDVSLVAFLDGNIWTLRSPYITHKVISGVDGHNNIPVAEPQDLLGFSTKQICQVIDALTPPEGDPVRGPAFTGYWYPDSVIAHEWDHVTSFHADYFVPGMELVFLPKLATSAAFQPPFDCSPGMEWSTTSAGVVGALQDPVDNECAYLVDKIPANGNDSSGLWWAFTHEKWPGTTYSYTECHAYQISNGMCAQLVLAIAWLYNPDCVW